MRKDCTNDLSCYLTYNALSADLNQYGGSVQRRDRRRLDPSMRVVPRTACAALRYKTKSPRPAPGAHVQTAGFRLPAGHEAGSATRPAARTAAQDITARHKLDPKRTVAFVVRGGTGLAKGIQ